MINPAVQHSDSVKKVVNLLQKRKKDFRLHTPQCLQRSVLEAYIADKFYQEHQAEIKTFAPILLSLSVEDDFRAALGLRPGTYRPMFLEQYLSSPAEQVIARLSNRPVSRESLVEIGNLVVTGHRAGLLLLIVTAMSLAEAGFQWMLFTATPAVEKSIRYLGLDLQVIAEARPENIADAAENWGSYYDNRPRVMAGNLCEGLAKAVDSVACMPELQELLDAYKQEVSVIAESMVPHRQQRLC